MNNTLSRLNVPDSTPLARIQSTPSPSSSSSHSSGSGTGSGYSESIFDSPDFALLATRRSSEPPVDGERRISTGSMTSWGSEGGADGIFKPPDHSAGASTTVSSDSLATYSTTHSPHEVTTPDADQVDKFATYFIQRPSGSISPASSATSTAPSKGEATPRAELPAPVWPLPRAAGLSSGDAEADDEMDGGLSAAVKRNDSFTRRKHASLDRTGIMPNLTTTFTPTLPHNNSQNTSPVTPPSPNPLDPPRRASDSAASAQRVVAQSSATGCRISAPISPPAHYPGSAQARATSSRTSTDTSDSNSMSSSNSSGSSYSSYAKSRITTPAPRWAHPPQHTNKISGRAWSFSQGQERPDVDFDPELFDHAEPDAVQEILKGMEGRIAVKTTPVEYNIMAWLPGFSIDDITISMKGDRTVQIVADLWDEGDHAQWNVLLGEDVNKAAISATFKGSELRVTVKRRQAPPPRSIRSHFSSWSAPGMVVAPPQINGGISTATPNRPPIATYGRPPQVTQ